MQNIQRNRKMVDARLDGSVHKSNERTVTRISKDGVVPQRVHDKDPAHLNANLIALAFIAVAANLAYGHKQATRHRIPRMPPKTAPPLVK